MRKIYSLIFLFCTAVLPLSACSVFGKTDIETAPYTVLQKQDNLELRHYDRLVLVSTPMQEGMKEQKDPFYRLFNYISGKNKADAEIPMTSPVFLDQNTGQTTVMSFVLPAAFTIEDAPLPRDPAVKLEQLRDYTVAVITFNGFLNQKTINENNETLKNWIGANQWKQVGTAKAAGYNPPFTIPFFRRNEVLIPVETQEK